MSRESTSNRHAPFIQLVSVLGIALYLFNLCYAFDGTFKCLGDYTFVSRALSGTEPGEPGNRFADTWLARLPLPLPEQYVIGVDLQKKDFEKFGQPSYLRGEWAEGGWWHYYLYGLAVKMPHGTQFLFLLVLLCNASGTVRWFAVNRHITTRGGRSEPAVAGATLRVNQLQSSLRWQSTLPGLLNFTTLLLPPLILFVIVSGQLEFNQHLRYVLPCQGFLFVFLGQAARLWGRWGPGQQPLVENRPSGNIARDLPG